MNEKEIKDMIEPIPNWEFTYRYDCSRTCGKSYTQSLLDEKDKKIKDLQQRVEQLEKENEKLRDKIVELQGYKEAIYEIKKYIDAYSPYFLETQEQNNQTIAIIIDNIGNLGDK